MEDTCPKCGKKTGNHRLGGKRRGNDLCPECKRIQDVARAIVDIRERKDFRSMNVLDALYEEGLRSKNTGNLKKAISTWKRILEKEFCNLRAVNAVAGAYAASGRLDLAKRYIALAMKVGSRRADFERTGLAGVLFDSGKFPEAGEILGAIDSGDPRTINDLTRALHAQGKAEKALELIEDFLSTDSASAAAATDGERSLQEIFLRGVRCTLQRRPASVSRFLEAHGRILPPGPLAAGYFNAGIHFLQDEDDPVRALKLLSEAAKHDPADPEIREALDDAALKVISDLEGQRKFTAADKAALALAYRTVGRSIRPAEGEAAPPPEAGAEKGSFALQLVTPAEKAVRETPEP